ncbi:GSCOCG00003751001-RA-CDS [Cotesia congregata]|nr:GSCOCG00003751001-RA-CDS [Cotesia congregata]
MLVSVKINLTISKMKVHSSLKLVNSRNLKKKTGNYSFLVKIKAALFKFLSDFKRRDYLFHSTIISFRQDAALLISFNSTESNVNRKSIRLPLLLFPENETL